ncbi:MAG: hypothetical protein IJT27_03570 [Clostridia bacterium]|nr:hypothetical protein [Clostridia bacterium]
MFQKMISMIIAAVLGFWGTAGRLAYPAFYKNAEKVADIPGLADGFVPQGTTYDAETASVLVCGYMEDESASRLYVIPAAGEVRMLALAKTDGSVYTGHAGGVTVAGSRVLISNASTLFMLDLAAVREASDGDELRFTGGVRVPCNASFCSCDGERIYVGEFHGEGYETAETHAVTLSNGETYQALVFAYALNEAFFTDEETPAPEAAYAVCDHVQGFACLPDGKAALSCSYGLKSASLRFYDASGESDGVYSGEGYDVPLYILDGARELKTLRLPHMSEDLEYTAKGLLIAFESAANKYGRGFSPFSVGAVIRYTPAF